MPFPAPGPTASRRLCLLSTTALSDTSPNRFSKTRLSLDSKLPFALTKRLRTIPGHSCCLPGMGESVNNDCAGPGVAGIGPADDGDDGDGGIRRGPKPLSVA